MLLSQGIQVLAAPILGRLYSPSSFGEWTLLLSLAGIASSIGGLRYELAIVPAASDEEAAGVMVVQTLSNAAVTAVGLLAILMFGGRIAEAIGAPGLGLWIYCVPVIAFLNGLGNVATYGLIRSKCFKDLALFRSVQALLGASAQVASGFINSGPGGLIVGGVLGQFALLGAISALLKRGYGRMARIAVSHKKLLGYAHKHRNFPKFMVAYGLAGVLRDRGLLLVLGSFGTIRDAGLFAFALRIIYAPMGLIANSFNSVVYQKAAESTAPADIGPLIYRLMSKLVTFAVPAFVIVAWFSARLFAVLFGRQWQEAGFYAAIMVPPALSHLLAGPFDRMFDIVGRQKTAMRIEVGYSILSLAAFTLVLIVYHSVPLAVAVFSGITVLYDAVWMIAVYHAYHLQYADLLKIGARILFVGGSVLLALWAAQLAFTQFIQIK